MTDETLQRVTSFDQRSKEASQDRQEPDLGDGFIQRIVRRGSATLQAFPGYSGYREKEDRRDADRRVRDHLVQEYRRQLGRVERVARDLASDRKIMEIGPVDELAKAIRHLSDRINTVSYGYGGLFSDRDIDASALDQMRLFDEGLLSGVSQLDSPIGALEAAYGSDGDLSGPSRAGRDLVSRLNERFDTRGRVIESGAPEPEESVRALLALDAASGGPAPVYWLDAGDAIDVMGQSGIVDSRLDVSAGAASIRLFRFSSSPEEQWLLVPAQPGAALALVSPRPSPGASAASDQETTVGDETFRITATTNGQAELITPAAVSGYRPVTARTLATADGGAVGLLLDWGNEQQVFTGLALGFGDVENYGNTGAAPRQGS